MDGLTKYLQQFKTPPKPKGGDDSVAKVLDDEFAKLGYGDTARLSILGDVGRENNWNRNIIFKGHADPKNKKFNRGIISWQGDRQTKLEKFLKGQGVYGRNDDDELRGMARFMDEELKKDFPQVYKKLTGARSTYDASEALRQYIKYVPEAPYNTPDPEFRVKNNANWAKRAKNLGLGMRGLTQYLQQFKGDEPEAAPTGDLSSYLQQFKEEGAAPPPTFKTPVAPIDVDKAFESPVQTLGGTEYAETAQTEAEALLGIPGIAQPPSGFPTAPTMEGAEPVVGQPATPRVSARQRLSGQPQQPTQQQTDTDVVVGEDEGFTATVNPSEGSGDALANILDQAAGQLARYADVDYDTARQYVQQMNLQGMSGDQYDPNAKLDFLRAEQLKGQQTGIQFGPGDLERVRSLDVEMQKANRRKATQTATAENQVKQYIEGGEVESVAQLLAAKDVGVKNVGGRSIDDLIQEERDAVKRFDDDWLAQSEERQKQSEAYSQLTPTAPQFTDSERQRFLEGRASARKDEIAAAMKEYGSLTKRESEKARIAEEYKTRPLAKPLEFAKGIGSVIPKGVAAILKTSDILDEINPASTQNIVGYFSGKEFKADEGEAHKIGQRLDEALEAYQNKDLKAYYQAGDSIGQVGVQIGLGALTGGLAAPLLYGSSLGASSQYEEAGKLGAGKYTRQAAAVLGGLTAISDALPVAWALKPLRKGAVGNILNGFLNRAYKDAVKEVGEKEAQSFVRELFKRTVDRAKTVATGAALETGQEVFLDKKINDLYASLTYDPTRKVFEISNDDLETAFYAAIGGAGGGAARVAIENRVAPKDNLSILLDKQGNEFEVVEDRGEKVLVKDEKGKISVRNKDRLTVKPIDEKPKVQESKPPVETAALAKDLDAEGEAAKSVESETKITLGDLKVGDTYKSDVSDKTFTVVNTDEEGFVGVQDNEGQQWAYPTKRAIPEENVTRAKSTRAVTDFSRPEAKAMVLEAPKQTRMVIEPPKGVTGVEKPKQQPLSNTQVEFSKKDAKVFERFRRTIIDPADVADKSVLPEYAKDGIFEIEPHITVKYGLHTNKSDEVAPMLEGEKPVTVKLGKTSVFKGSEKKIPGTDKPVPYDVVIVAVESPDLERLNKKLTDGPENTTTFPYSPHVTLAYVKAGQGEKYANRNDFEGKTFTFDGVTFSPADKSGKTKIAVGTPKQSAKQRLAEKGRENVIIHQAGDFDVRRSPQGWYEVYQFAGTHAKRVASFGGKKGGEEWLQRAIADANRRAEESTNPPSSARERFEKKKADRVAEIDASIENKKALRDAPGSTPAKKRIYNQTIAKLEAERKTLAPKKAEAQTVADVPETKEKAKPAPKQSTTKKIVVPASKAKRYATVGMTAAEVQEQIATEEFKKAEALSKTQKEDKNGFTPAQKAYLAKALEEYAAEYPADAPYAADSVDTVRTGGEVKEHHRQPGLWRPDYKQAYASSPQLIASRRSEEVDPETIIVPDDGTFRVTDMQQANRLYQKITGKPLKGKPKEKIASSAFAGRLPSTVPGQAKATNLSRAKSLIEFTPDNNLEASVNIPIETINAEYIADTELKPKKETHWRPLEIRGVKGFTDGALAIQSEGPLSKGDVKEFNKPIDFEIVIGKEKDLNPVKAIRAASYGNGRTVGVEFDNGSVIQFAYYNAIKSRFPAAVFRAETQEGVIIIDSGKRVVGAVMPVRSVELDEPLASPAPQEAQDEPLQMAAGEQTETDVFKKWFGDSKVVDADGKPLRVFHGTERDFERFEARKPTRINLVDGKEIQTLESWDTDGSYTENPEAYHWHLMSDLMVLGSPKRVEEFRRKEMVSDSPSNRRYWKDFERLKESKVTHEIVDRPSGDAAWFTPDTNYSFISRQRGDGNFAGGQVMPVYLSIQNPKYVDHSEVEGGGRSWNVEKYKQEGYDGLIAATRKDDLTYTGWDGATQIVAFYPNQIKSAIGNRGTFDPNEDSILKKAAEEGDKEYLTELRKAHTEDLTTNAVSKFTDGNLELNEEAGELLRRIEGSTFKPVGGFYGVTYSQSQLVKLADAADDFIQKYKELGYTEPQLKGLQQLADNLRELSKTDQQAGIAYVYDFALPHETHHQLVLNALGGKSFPKKALADLEKLDIWNDKDLVIQQPSGETRKFNVAYRGRKGSIKAIELAAMLETGEIRHPDKEAFLDIFARGILEVTDTLDPVAFARILDYANIQTSDTGSTPTGRIDAEAGGRVDEPAPTESEGDGQGTQDRTVSDDTRTAEEPGFRPDGREKLSQTPKSLRGKADIPVADRTYTGVTNKDQQAFADEKIDKGVDEADRWFNENADDDNLNNGATAVVGLNLLNHYAKTRQFKEMNAVADKLVPMVTQAAQTVQAMAVVSSFNPQMAAAYAAKVKKQKQGKDLTPEEAVKAERIAQHLSETAQAEGISEAALKEAEQFIKELRKDVEQANASIQTLSDENKIIKVNLDEARKTVRTQKAQITRLTNDKPRTPKAAMIKDLRKRKDEILTNLAEKYGTPSLKMVATFDDSLRMTADGEIDPDLIDWAILTLGENWSTLSVGEFYNLADRLTNGQLSNDQIKELHASAVEALRSDRTQSDNQKAAFKTRSEHMRAARKFRKDQGPNIDKTAAAIMRTGVENNYSDDAIIFALARKKHVNPKDAIEEYEQRTGEKPSKETMIEANRLINDTKRSIAADRFQAKSEETLTESDIESIKEEQRANRAAGARARKDANSFYEGLARTPYEVALETIVNLRRANLLTGIKTHLRNLTSNAMFAASEETSRNLAWLADAAASGLTGERTVQGMSPKAVYQSFKSLVAEDETFKNIDRESGLKIAKQIIMHGATFEELAKQQHSRSILGEKAGKPGKVLDAYINKVFDALGAEDAVFKTYAFRRSLEEQAKTMTKDKDERMKLILNPTNTMQMIASEYADFSTFTNDNVLSNLIRSAKVGAARQGKGGQALKALFETIVPYDRTPTNIFIRVMEHSPLGFVSAASKLKNLKQEPTKEFRNKYRGAMELDLNSSDDFNALSPVQKRRLVDEGLQKVFTRQQQQDFARTFGRAGLGTGVFGLGFFLAAAGLLTGSMSPEDDDREETNEFFKRREMGVENRSLLIPGVGRFVLPDDPLSKVLTAGATAYEQTVADRGAPVHSAWNGVKEVTEDAMFEQPLAGGVHNFYKQIKGAKLGEFAGGLIGTTLVPTFVSDIGEVADEKARTGSGYRPGEKRSILNPDYQFRGFKNTLLKRVPVVRNYAVDEATSTVPQEVRGGVLRRAVRAIDLFNTRPPVEYVPLTAPDNYDEFMKSGDFKKMGTDDLVIIIKYDKADGKDTKQMEAALKKKVVNAQKRGTFTADEATRVNEILGTNYRPDESRVKKRVPRPKAAQ